MQAGLRARPQSRFCVDIVILLLDNMFFGHAKQSELKLIRLSYTLIAREIHRRPTCCFATSIALVL